jgi:hypothetical protein
VHLDDGVVDIEQCVCRRRDRRLLLLGRVGSMIHQRGESGQRDQEPGGDRVKLADVAEGEGPQKRPQGRGRVPTSEQPDHPAVPQQRHVIDRVGAGDHPTDQRGDLEARVRALVGRHR